MRKVISLFSGAGGLDIGFKLEGFDIVWANDFDKDACQTYRNNIGGHIRCGDINNYIDELDDFKNKVDVLIGGPPCQGFSVAGKMDTNDPRSKNIWVYIDALSRIRPEVFVMENVKALGSLAKWQPIREELLRRMRALGYATNFVVLNASDFDVPQARERVFFIGFKNNASLIPDLEAMISKYREKGPTVRMILSEMDRPGTGNNKGVCKAKITLTPNPVLRKSPYAGMLFNGLGRPVKLDGYCATLPASMGGNKTPIVDERELYEGKEGWCKEYHQKLMAGNPPMEYGVAPSFLRRLTLEEAAVLQTFPKDYNFYGSQSSRFKQIGNAVPCNLGRAIARMISDYFAAEAEESLIFMKNASHQLYFEQEEVI